MASKVRPEPRYDARNLYRIKKVGSDLFTSQGYHQDATGYVQCHVSSNVTGDDTSSCESSLNRFSSD
ncbi:unnamed protein product [Musa acuminata var. zebrina]